MTMRPEWAVDDAAPMHGVDGVASTLQLHREQVVRRLLVGGISETTLLRILPEWSPLIEETAAAL